MFEYEFLERNGSKNVLAVFLPYIPDEVSSDSMKGGLQPPHHHLERDWILEKVEKR